MNQRIQELQQQVMSLVLNGNDPDGDVEKMYVPAEFTKKLAELIVRECARVHWNIDDGELHEEYVSALKKHFGVK